MSTPQGDIELDACWFTLPSATPFSIIVKWNGVTKTAQRSSTVYSESCCNFKVATISYRNSDKLFTIDKPFIQGELPNAINTGEPTLYPEFESEYKTIPQIYPPISNLDVINSVQPSANFTNPPVISETYPTFDVEHIVNFDTTVPSFSLPVIDAIVVKSDITNSIVTSNTSYPTYDSDVDLYIEANPPIVNYFTNWKEPNLYNFNNALLTEDNNYVIFDSEYSVVPKMYPPYMLTVAPTTWLPSNISMYGNALVSNQNNYPLSDSEYSIVPKMYPPYMLTVAPATPLVYLISGSVTTSGYPLSNVIISTGPVTIATNSNGIYTLQVLAGTYSISASIDNYTIQSSPISADATTSDVTGVNFIAHIIPPLQYQLSNDIMYNLDGIYQNNANEKSVMDFVYNNLSDRYEPMLVSDLTYKIYRNVNNSNKILVFSTFYGALIAIDMLNIIYSLYPCVYVHVGGYQVNIPTGYWRDLNCSNNLVVTSLI
jgi:hypothetical protein